MVEESWLLYGSKEVESKEGTGDRIYPSKHTPFFLQLGHTS
jgi:hypothetical protein